MTHPTEEKLKTIEEFYEDLQGLLPRHQVEDLILWNKKRILSSVQGNEREMKDVVNSYLLAIGKNTQKELLLLKESKTPTRTQTEIRDCQVIAVATLLIAYQTLKFSHN